MNLIKHLHQITLQESDNKIKGIMKVIKSLENREILLTGTTRKIIKQEGRFLNFLIPLITTGLHLMKSELTLLAKSALLPLGLSAKMSAADWSVQKKIHESGSTPLIISNEGMEDVMEIVKPLEESGLLTKRISERIKNETKEQKGWLLPISLEGELRAGQWTIRAGESF